MSFHERGKRGKRYLNMNLRCWIYISTPPPVGFARAWARTAGAGPVYRFRTRARASLLSGTAPSMSPCRRPLFLEGGGEMRARGSQPPLTEVRLRLYLRLFFLLMCEYMKVVLTKTKRAFIIADEGIPHTATHTDVYTHNGGGDNERTYQSGERSRTGSGLDG